MLYFIYLGSVPAWLIVYHKDAAYYSAILVIGLTQQFIKENFMNRTRMLIKDSGPDFISLVLTDPEEKYVAQCQSAALRAV